MKAPVPILPALALLACAWPAAARDRQEKTLATAPAEAAQPARPPMRFDAGSPTSARMPLTGDVDVGIGLYSVTGHFVRDRGARGREPFADTRGRESKVAAVGFSLRF